MEHFQEKVGLSLLLSLLTGVFAWVAFAHAPLSALCVTLGALACWLVALFFAAPFYTVYRDQQQARHQQQAFLLEGRARAKALQLKEQQVQWHWQQLQDETILRSMELAIEQQRADLERLRTVMDTLIQQGQFHLEQQRFAREQQAGPLLTLSTSQWLYEPHTDRRIGPPRNSGPGELAAPAVLATNQPLPGPCRLVEVIKRVDLSPEAVFLALARGDRLISCSLQGLMHVAQDSPTGQGKTSLSYAHMVMLLWMQTHIIIANPHFIPLDKTGRDWRPIGRAVEQQGELEVAPGRWMAPLVRQPQHIEALLRWLATVEIDRRFALMEQGDFSFKPLYLFIDEWPYIVSQCPQAAKYQTLVLQRGRAVDVCVSTCAQGFLLRDSELVGSARENFNTAYHMGGSPRSASVLLDLPVAEVNKLRKGDDVPPLGKGVALLRNNEACPSAQLVRLPYADNEFAYYLLGRADEWRMKGLPNS